MSKRPKITPSSGNVFLDIGFEPEEAERLLRKADADTKPTLVEKMALEACEADPDIGRHPFNYQGCVCKRDGRNPATGPERCQERVTMNRAALAVVMEEMREPSEGMWHAGALAGSQGRTRAIWGWQAMLAAFEKEQADG